MNNDVKVDAVVVTYNRLQLLKECLSSLLSQGDGLSHIFVIDNKSTDGTSDFLSSITDDRVISETLESNIGGAAGFEFGVTKAVNEGNADYIWIMDDDTIPQDGALESLLSSAKTLENKFGFLCSNVRWTDGTPSNIATPSREWPDKVDDGLIKVENATFVSVLVHRSAIVAVGFPIGAMKIWGDDTEYTKRLSNYMPSYFDLNSKVIHKSAFGLESESLLNTSADRLWRYESSFRNGIYVNRKYDSGKKVAKSVVHNVLTGLRAMKAEDKKIKRLTTAIKGTMKGLKFNPEIKFPRNK
ncbi:glycosyltransferase family 2 protein [Pediococcus pentosaceus]|jgi:GT2 family glycosyltransferase|uniref:glycosyltransferase family 2 protein n=1 Tax=Pediococcus pentosaceus TaxID=1255 RepID=UPI0018A1413E|nr:glycosyltransferase family 2 protein [Pediococcus pentosaceus]MBF7120227.1 glycosyltransferase family 2 protein [Pediococcus pentosaceus]MBF7140308.1 glycosyltransferase family 2 protein [Pediococcus pentosaceus]MCG7196818.1 glycosyltransferase family 2 protein [Pediococcus pentosaceus]MCI2396783.1 glycosyltransferase family 2 protein [Pediococcus pentosaceus]MCM6819409.1 glycosyltransferase family 2 protein [Pediococcus pentosaceus]